MHAARNLEVGETLQHYRVLEKIGTGGMADVYKAVDEVLGRTVAVKVMHPRYAADPSLATRFRQEAQAAANLQSPNIVNMYDWGADGDTYYMVMEYVRGTDLKAIIQQKGWLSSAKVAGIGAQVCARRRDHGGDRQHRVHAGADPGDAVQACGERRRHRHLQLHGDR